MRYILLFVAFLACFCPFLAPWKHYKVSTKSVFRGYKTRTLAQNGLRWLTLLYLFLCRSSLSSNTKISFSNLPTTSSIPWNIITWNDTKWRTTWNVLVNLFITYYFLYSSHIFSILKSFQNEILSGQYIPEDRSSRHLLNQSPQWKRQNNVWNLYKVNNKDNRTMSLMSLWGLYG